jgi:hypothetical protein
MANETQAVTVEIEAPRGGAENLLARAELHFHTGLLAGLRRVGIGLWKAQGQNGAFVSVTFLAQSAEKEGGIVYYDHVRGQGENMKRLKAAIVSAYRESRWNGLKAGERPPATTGRGQDARAQGYDKRRA